MGLYRISELAERTGFSASALRFYEQAGLLSASERSAGGYRLYDQAAVERLAFIARAKQLGLAAHHRGPVPIRTSHLRGPLHDPVHCSAVLRRSGPSVSAVPAPGPPWR
jgi:hypothetical protein